MYNIAERLIVEGLVIIEGLVIVKGLKLFIA